MKVYDKIEELINRYLEEEEEQEEECFTGGVEDDKLQLAEQFLNVRFPESYKWFLKKYGAGEIAGTNIMGIEKDEEDIERFTVVYATKKAINKYVSIKKGFIVIEYLEDEAMCLDTNRMEKGECPVVSCITHGQGESEDVYKNFADYILQQLENAI